MNIFSSLKREGRREGIPRKGTLLPSVFKNVLTFKRDLTMPLNKPIPIPDCKL
jgi:hypothetical protein